MLKLWKDEILLFKSVADVLAFDKKYVNKFIWWNWGRTIQVNWEDIIHKAWVVNSEHWFRWVYNNSGRKEIYWKNLTYDL